MCTMQSCTLASGYTVSMELLYLKGLIEKIEAKFNAETRNHELEIHFQHPIVGDGIKWKDPKKKTLGYKVLNGSKTTSLQVEKRDGRGK